MSQRTSQENVSQEMAFDQAGIELLAAAFEKAWAFVKADPVLIEAGLTVTATDLAAALMTAVEQDSNPHGLANRAINSLRQRIQVRRSMMNVLAPDAVVQPQSLPNASAK
ncbi:MAG TPA: hypothetical protein VJL90_10575 [Pseudorhodoplanes sp.]|nr:hypothetical protein [Pseudorhodoplanes sp.]